VRGDVASGPIVVGLEAKADETFGQTVAAYRARGLAGRAAGESTNAPERLAGLIADVLGPSAAGLTQFASLRYQLFSAIAGTLAAATRGEIAAFVVHEFATDQTTSRWRDANRVALAQFVEAIGGLAPPAGNAWVLGPFFVAAERWSATPLWIGHLTTDRFSTA
jgi:TRAP-type C4-dicarboxylate transport system permease large subunit